MGVGALIGLTIAVSAAKGVEQAVSVSREKDALDEQSKNSQLQYLQKSNSRLSQLQNLLAKQQAVETTTGLNLGSASFNAIARSTVNISQKEQKNLDIEETSKQAAISSAKSNLDKSLFSQLFGDVAGAAESSALINKFK
jgi:hypothetical protein